MIIYHHQKEGKIMKSLFQENLVGNWTKDEAIQFIKEIIKLEEWKVESISTFIQKTPEEIISEVNTKISDKFISEVKVIKNSTSWKEIIFYFKNTTLLYSIKVEPDFQQKVMKLGKNDSGEWFDLSNFLNEFFLPLFTDWSPTTTVSESEFLNVLTKLNNFEVLKKKFDEMEFTELTHNQVVDFFTETIPEMEQSNLNFVLSTNCLLCPKNCLVWYGSENPDDVLIITLTCEHPELKNQDIFKMQFHVSKKDGNGFCELHLTSNTIPSLLEAAEIAYQFS